MLKKIVLVLFPPNTKRGVFVKRVAARFGLAQPYVYSHRYQALLDGVEDARFLLPIPYKKESAPLFSIVIPMYNTKDKYLFPLIESITNQSFTDWELVLADGSTEPDRIAAIREMAATDQRIRLFKLEKNEGISENTNRAIEKAEGKYVIFSDHDDTLSVHALNELAAVISQNPDTEIIYSDEDKLSDDGRFRLQPHFKAGWSPHQFLTCNYTNHISAVKRSLVNKVGGLRTEYNGAQDYDFLLRVHGLEGTRKVAHIPKILYHWRIAEGSTAGNFSVKEYALQAGQNALQEYLLAKGLEATVSSIKDRPGFYDPYIKPKSGRKTLVVLGEDADPLASIMLRDKYQALTDTTGISDVKFVTSKDADENIKKLRPTDFLVQIKDNIIPKSPDWLIRLLGALEMDDIKAVAPRIVTPDEKIWDMGMVIDIQGNYKDLFKGLSVYDDTEYGHTEWIRDVDALHTTFFACRVKDYDRKDIRITPTKDTYVTIWSPVEVVFQAPIKVANGQYNENLYQDENGR
ncbi:MAG: glycosyltransferase [Patescibacteria group bacterium]